MEKYFILIIIFILTGCGYRQEKEVRANIITGEPNYYIWIYKDSDLIEYFSIPIKSINKEKKDSLQKKADEFIFICKSID